MYKNYTYINAGDNKIYRWGKKAYEKLSACLEANENGYITVPANGGDYWTFGTSNGQYGDYAKYNGVCLSVNKSGFIWAKVGTPKAEVLESLIKDHLELMLEIRKENAEHIDELCGIEE